MNSLGEAVHAVFFIGIPGLLLGVFWRRYATTRRLLREGVHVQGTVLSVSPGGGDSNAELHYAFTLPDGREFQEKYDGSDDGWSGLGPGSPIDVTYLPENPRRSLPTGKGAELPETLVFTLGLLFMMCFGVGGLMGNRQRAADSRRSPLPQYEGEAGKPPRTPPPKGPRPLSEY
ncbi:DUF3592 domain-containing protein [Corallococcus sp. CA053C]|uniref:DUF3592 domain-containing protein n=1 Tax=Corallococcus sp. CA053C TaxID=2316732 RepID=UPI0013152E5C|nr:DUF3592 domain-containing protein [Corallococcus sp. CA053C]